MGGRCGCTRVHDGQGSGERRRSGLQAGMQALRPCAPARSLRLQQLAAAVPPAVVLLGRMELAAHNAGTAAVSHSRRTEARQPRMPSTKWAPSPPSTPPGGPSLALAPRPHASPTLPTQQPTWPAGWCPRFCDGGGGDTIAVSRGRCASACPPVLWSKYGHPLSSPCSLFPSCCLNQVIKLRCWHSTACIEKMWQVLRSHLGHMAILKVRSYLSHWKNGTCGVGSLRRCGR